MHQINCPADTIINIENVKCSCGNFKHDLECVDSTTCNVNTSKLKCDDLTLSYSCKKNNKTYFHDTLDTSDNIENENKLQVSETDMDRDLHNNYARNIYNKKDSNKQCYVKYIIILIIFAIFLYYNFHG